MKTKQFIFIGALILVSVLTSCKKDTPIPSSTTYTNGVFVLNQGQYGSGTGTVSFYSRQNGTVVSDVFGPANGGITLGNIVQSMAIYNGKGYIVVNNTGKMVIVNSSTFVESAQITTLKQPRYFLAINTNKGYVSQWGSTSGSIQVINLSTNTVTKSITTGQGAENMILSGNYVYVACSGGDYNDSIVTVIDATADTVIKNINVGPNPTYIQQDANGQIWVLCVGEWNSGYTALIKPGSLFKINPSTNTVELSLPFSSIYSQPSNLVINGSKNTLYYNYNGAVYSQSSTSYSLNLSLVINRNFFGLGIDPATDYFYGAVSESTSNGKVIRYNTSAVAVDSFAVGIYPGNFCFE